MKSKPVISPEDIFLSKMQSLKENGWTLMSYNNHCPDAELEGVSSKIDLIQNVLKQNQSKNTEMIGFILYDIEDNKVRNYISKYLIRKGCMRIQKSVFFCNLPHKEWRELKKTLAEVNEMYENKDSIFLLPVQKDILNSATCIGHQFIHELKDEKPNIIFL